MSVPILPRSAARAAAVPVLLLLAVLATLPRIAPAWADDDGTWTVNFLAQSDSRAELRPCT